jgi:transposase
MGMDTFIYREYAYSKKGIKVTGRISGKKYKRTSLVAAKMGSSIISPLQYDGSMDSVLFEHWFEFCLIPSLPSSATISMDNASFHRKSRLILLAEKYGHRIIFLPPYSPELNKIENFWAWLKGKLKKVIHNFDDFDEALRYCFIRI